MRETEFWQRMAAALGDAYCHVWASQHSLRPLNSRTVEQALADGIPPKRIWHAVWEALELPEKER